MNCTVAERFLEKSIYGIRISCPSRNDNKALWTVPVTEHSATLLYTNSVLLPLHFFL